MRRAISALIFAVSAGAALAVESDYKGCADLKEDAARLACYDAATRRFALAQADVGGWTIWEGRDDLTARKQITLVLQAKRFTVHDDTFRNAREALLMLTCTGGSVSLVFRFDRLVASDAVAAKYRIGDSEPRASRWPGAQNNRGFGPWEKPEARRMLTAMLEAAEMFVQTDTRTFGSTSATYELKGLKTAIAPHAALCGLDQRARPPSAASVKR